MSFSNPMLKVYGKSFLVEQIFETPKNSYTLFEFLRVFQNGNVNTKTTNSSLNMVGQRFVPCIKIEELPSPGSATSRSVEGVAICIVVDKVGSIFALADKCPPAGKRLSLGKICNDGTIQDPALGTKFSLRTGDVVGPWCPEGIGKLIGPVFTPVGVATFPIRQKGRSLVVQIDVHEEEDDNNVN